MKTLVWNYLSADEVNQEDAREVAETNGAALHIIRSKNDLLGCLESHQILIIDGNSFVWINEESVRKYMADSRSPVFVHSYNESVCQRFEQLGIPVFVRLDDTLSWLKLNGFGHRRAA